MGSLSSPKSLDGPLGLKHAFKSCVFCVPFYRGNYDYVTFKLPLAELKCLVTKNKHTLASEIINMQY